MCFEVVVASFGWVGGWVGAWVARFGLIWGQVTTESFQMQDMMCDDVHMMLQGEKVAIHICAAIIGVLNPYLHFSGQIRSFLVPALTMHAELLGIAVHDAKFSAIAVRDA